MDAVQDMTVEELARRLAEAGGDAHFLDVRTDGEWQLARIDGFRLVDAAVAAEVEALDREAELVFLCHHGIRSDAAARHFAALGFHRVWNVVGGIDAWSREIDPDVSRY